MRLVIVLLALILAVVFAVQNATMVTLSVFAWQLSASLAVIIVLCFAIGAIAASLAMLPSIYRHRNHARKLQSELAALRLSQEPGLETKSKVQPPVPASAPPLPHEEPAISPRSGL